MKTQNNFNRSKEFTIDEIKNLVDTLKENPVNEFYKPRNLGWCSVQRIPANQTSGRWSLISVPHDITTPQDLFSRCDNDIYLQIERTPNACFWEERGRTYMCWK